MPRGARTACCSAIVALVLTSSCESGTEPAKVVQDVPLTRVSYAPTGALHARERTVIRSQAEWKAFWLRVWPYIDMAAPAFDFTRDFLVVAAAGDQPSSGYAIRLESAKVRDGRLVVQVRTTAPGSRCGVYWVITQPIDVARVPRTSLPIEFEERAESLDCPL